jgi:hypothetical protein
MTLGCILLHLLLLLTSVQDATSPDIKEERRGSTASQNVAKNAEPSTTDPTADGQNTPSGPNDTMAGNNSMMNGMQGQMGFGFTNQTGFNNGMGWNGMNQMGGMPNMMGNGNWNGMSHIHVLNAKQLTCAQITTT